MLAGSRGSIDTTPILPTRVGEATPEEQARLSPVVALLLAAVGVPDETLAYQSGSSVVPSGLFGITAWRLNTPPR